MPDEPNTQPTIQDRLREIGARLYYEAGEADDAQAVSNAADRIDALENAVRELRDNIGTGWPDDALKSFASRALDAS